MIHHVVDIDVVSKSNHALCVCDLICLPVSSVGQRETRSSSEYTTLFLYIILLCITLEIVMDSVSMLHNVVALTVCYI